ncbi:MAG: hypothetical protein ACKO4K_00365 [Flavobacteriales bacterium]
MKRTMMNFGAMLFVSAAFLTSCGGGGKEDGAKKPEKKKGDYTLAVEKSMSGDFSKYYEVTKAVLKIEEIGSKLMVEVKRTDVPFDGIEVDHLKFENEGVADKYKYDIKADLLGENDLPLESSLGEYGNDPFVTMRSLKAGETVWLEFSAGGGIDGVDPTKAKKVKLASTLSVNENYGKESAYSGSSDDSGSSPDDVGGSADASDDNGSENKEQDAASKTLMKIGEKAAEGMIKSGYIDRQLKKLEKN